MKRKTIVTIAKVLTGIVLSAGVSYFINHLLQEHYRKITISRDTTYVLGPVFSDGYVDYLSALDSQFSQGVTPENNAAIPLFKAIGLKDTIRAVDRPRLLAALHMPDVPDDTDTFTEYSAFCVNKAKAAAGRNSINNEGDVRELAWDQQAICAKSPWTAAQYPDVAQWLQKSAPALQLACDASKCQFYYVPLIGRPGLGSTLEVNIPSVGMLRELANALAARSMLAIAHGDFAAWREDFLAQQRLGRLLMHTPTLIQSLVGIAIIDQAYQQIPFALEHLSVDPSRQLLGDLRALDPTPDMVDCIDHCERLMPIGEITTLARFGPVESLGSGSDPLPAPRWFGFQPPIHFDDLLRQYNELWDREVAALRVAKYSQRVLAISAVEADRKASLAATTGSNSTAAIQRLILEMGNSFSSSRLLQDREHQNLRLTQLTLLLHIYHLEHNSYPPTLADLPDLRDSNLDLFADDAPIHYVPSADSCLIYSVGPNQRDDAGKRSEPKVARSFNLLAPSIPPEFDDIAIRLPSSPASRPAAP